MFIVYDHLSGPMVPRVLAQVMLWCPHLYYLSIYGVLTEGINANRDRGGLSSVSSKFIWLWVHNWLWVLKWVMAVLQNFSFDLLILLICQQRYFYSKFFNVFIFRIQNAFLTFFILGVNVFLHLWLKRIRMLQGFYYWQLSSFNCLEENNKC